MAKAGYYFTEDDARIFKILVERERKRDHGKSNPEYPNFGDAPACYVAKVPISGIAPITYSSPYDTLGSALCDIYKPTLNVGTGAVELQRVVGFRLRVYNTSNAWIEGYPFLYIIIKKEAYGRWVYECPCPPTPTGTGSTGTSGTGSTGTSGTGSTGTSGTGSTGTSGTGSTGTGSTGTGSTGTGSSGTGSTGTGSTGTGSTGTDVPWECGACTPIGANECWFEWTGLSWDFRSDLSDCPQIPSPPNCNCTTTPPPWAGTFNGELTMIPCGCEWL